MLLQGSGVLVNRGSIRFRQGFRCKGDFRFLANGDITVEKAPAWKMPTFTPPEP